MQKKTADIASALLLFCITGLGFIYTSSLPPAGSHTVYGPAFFPQLLLYLIGIGATIQFVSAVWRPNSGRVGEVLSRPAKIRVLAFVGLLSTYVLLFLYVGFLISTVIYLFIAQWLFGRRDWLGMGARTILITAAAYALLTYAFQVQLP